MLSLLCEDGVCLITDLFCEESKDDYKLFRMSELKITEDEWNRRYSAADHLYLNREKTRSICEKMGFDVKIINNMSIGYNHGRFRFDLLARRKANI